MLNFEKLLENSKINFEKCEVKESGTLEVNFKDLLTAALKDILQHKSELFRSMKEKGIEVDFRITLPENNVEGSVYELVSNFKKDVE